MVLFTYGFRVFFLAAGLYAVAAVAAWFAWLALHVAGAVVTTPTFAGAAHIWHGHEMVYGYALAALSGFLLTAAPNWTGGSELKGPPLMLLAAVWLAGRVALWLSALAPSALIAAIDLAYVPLLAFFVGRTLFVKPAPRNLVFLVLLTILFAANLGVHLEWTGVSENSAAWGLHLAIVTLAAMITIIGGRIVPAFTRNALARAGVREGLPRGFAPLDALSVASALGVAACFALAAPDRLTGSVAALAAAANLVRLAFWRADKTLRDPIVWVLHLAYLWLPVGFAAIAAQMLLGALPAGFALHALGIGAVGGMTLAVMTRAALGHSGRPLVAPRAIVAGYVCVALAAFVRVLAPVAFSGFYLETVLVAGALWLVAFTLFAFTYWPILLRPSLSQSGRI